MLAGSAPHLTPPRSVLGCEEHTVTCSRGLPSLYHNASGCKSEVQQKSQLTCLNNIFMSPPHNMSRDGRSPGLIQQLNRSSATPVLSILLSFHNLLNQLPYALFGPKRAATYPGVVQISSFQGSKKKFVYLVSPWETFQISLQPVPGLIDQKGVACPLDPYKAW